MSKQNSRPNVVTIGGGTGMPAILTGLKSSPVNLTAIVTVGDDGGSTGILRRKLHAVPMGDIRNSVAALSTLPRTNVAIFQSRFARSDDFLSNHTIGNLVIAVLEEKEHGIVNAVRVLNRAMRTRGTVYPVCNGMLTLHARFTDGTTQTGESEITGAGKAIQKLGVTNPDGSQPEAIPEAVKAVKDADLIVLGPGSLYTSVMPNLLIPNLRDAVVNAKAPVVYVCNVLTQKGETMHYTAADHVKALNRQVGTRFVNYAIVNDAPVPKGAVNYRQHVEYSAPVRSDPADFKSQNCRLIASDFLQLGNGNAYDDTTKVAKVLSKLASQAK